MACCRASAGAQRLWLGLVACAITFFVSGGLVQGVTGFLGILDKVQYMFAACSACVAPLLVALVRCRGPSGPSALAHIHRRQPRVMCTV